MANSDFNRRMAVYKKCDGHCAYCGKKITYQQLTIDHILPNSLRHENKMVNFLPACKACNRTKCVLSVEEYRKKVAIISDELPVEFFFEREQFRETLKEEIEIARKLINQDFLFNESEALRASIAEKSLRLRGLNRLEFHVQQIEGLRRKVQALQAVIDDKMFSDRMVNKLRKRADVDQSYIRQLRELIKNEGSDELKTVFHELALKYGKEVEALKHQDLLITDNFSYESN